MHFRFVTTFEIAEQFEMFIDSQIIIKNIVLWTDS